MNFKIVKVSSNQNDSMILCWGSFQAVEMWGVGLHPTNRVQPHADGVASPTLGCCRTSSPRRRSSTRGWPAIGSSGRRSHTNSPSGVCPVTTPWTFWMKNTTRRPPTPSSMVAWSLRGASLRQGASDGGDDGGRGLWLGQEHPQPLSPNPWGGGLGGTSVTLDHHSKVCVLPTPTVGPSPLVGDCPLPLGQVFRCLLHLVVPGSLFAGTSASVARGHCEDTMGLGGWMCFILP